MAMSRAKSFLPHTQTNLWRRDMQHDLTVMDSVGVGRVSTGSPMLPCAGSRLAATPCGALSTSCCGAGWLNKQVWVAAVALSNEGLYKCPKGSALVFQRHKFVIFFLNHISAVGWRKMDDRTIFGSSSILLKITFFFSITSISDCNVCNNAATFLTKTCWRDCVLL